MEYINLSEGRRKAPANSAAQEATWVTGAPKSIKYYNHLWVLLDCITLV
jgi:hypothetical protein